MLAISLAGSLWVPATAFALPPVNVTPPTISGTAQEGQQLSCSDGRWLFSPTSYAYQWNRDAVAIGGATSSTYTVQSADVGHLVTCSVTASNGDGSSLLPATSLPVIPTASPPVNVLPPLITGIAQEGSEVACSDGTWLNSPTSFSKQWNRDGTAIPGETGGTYTLVAADVGHLITCVVVADNGAQSLPATSLPVTPIPAALLNTAKPQISGTAQPGQQLSCSTGSWLPEPDSFDHAWERAGSPIPGAATSTYAVQAEDVGTALTCTVTATNLAGSVDATSDPVTPTAAGGGGGGGTAPPATGTGQQPGPATASDGTEPVVIGFALTRRRFAVGRAATPVAAARAKQGTAFRLTLSEAAYVELAISRSQRGYRVGRRCVARVPTSVSSRPRRCRFERKAGKLARAAAAGANRIAFSGRVGRRALEPGRYVVTIRARDAAGNVSAPRKARFQAVSGKTAPR